MTVQVVAGGRTVVNWSGYSIDLDMLTPGDSFDLTIGPVRRDVWDLFKPDTEVSIVLRGDHGNSPLITGLVDERVRTGGRTNGAISVMGRDKVGRFLVDDAMDLKTFDEGTALDAIKSIAGSFFESVVVSNARNRELIVGRRATTVKVVAEPLSVGALGQLSIAQQFVSPGTGLAVIEGSAGKRQGPKKVEPGDTRAETIAHFLEPDRLLFWGSGDGKELIVGRPNYTQPTRFRFTAPSEASERASDSNVLDFTYRENVAEMFSQVDVVGASQGNSARYARQVTKHRAIAVDGSGADGTGNAFQRRKLQIVPEHKLRSTAHAAELARRHMALGQATRFGLELTVRGHHQGLTRSGLPQLFAPDTILDWTDEELGIQGRWLIIGVGYRRSKGDRSSVLRCVPEGTELAQ